MTVTATGRLSSTEPNLQNIPVRKELGAQIRTMFAAPDGKVLVDADYSQIELRLLAHISGDRAMQEAFLSGEDFHTVTASKVFNVPIEEVSHTLRSRAKAVNFGIVYGISAFSLAQDIGVRPAEAREYMNAYLNRYSGVRDYMHNVVEQARADGYVRTLWNRRRDLPELRSSNFNTRAFGERVALNMPIQGTAGTDCRMPRGRDRHGHPDSEGRNGAGGIALSPADGGCKSRAHMGRGALMFRTGKINEAREQIVRELASIETECFSSPLTPEQICRLIPDEHTHWLAVWEDAVLAGYVWVQTVLDEGYIGNVAVRRASRRRGAGDRLLEMLDSLAEEEKLHFLTLEVRAGNLPALALYEKHGYRRTGERKGYYTEPREDAVLMTKEFS